MSVDVDTKKVNRVLEAHRTVHAVVNVSDLNVVHCTIPVEGTGQQQPVV